MNQIPNREETHNTREVEEVVKEFYKIFDTDNLWQGEDEWTKNVPIGNIEQWLRTTLHQQLQKARKGNANELYGEGHYNGVMYERERIEAIFKEHVPQHAMDLEDSVWLKRLLNKAFNHDKNV